jgi:hypothetical protein
VREGGLALDAVTPGLALDAETPPIVLRAGLRDGSGRASSLAVASPTPIAKCFKLSSKAAACGYCAEPRCQPFPMELKPLALMRILQEIAMVRIRLLGGAS